MNELIESIFANFQVGGKAIPVKFIYYEGHGEPYVCYQSVYSDGSVSGDDDLLSFVEYYDFDVYSRGNYTPIVQAIIDLMVENGFTWQPSRDSADLYESDTGYYHKTLSFAIAREAYKWHESV